MIISTNTIRCAKCGACTVVCPVFKASGGRETYSARGKNHLAALKDYEQPTAAFEDIFAKCLLCGACTKACPRGINVTHEVIHARSGFSRFYGEHGFEKFLARKALHRPELLRAAGLMGKAAGRLTRSLPKDSGLRLRMAMFEPQRGISHGRRRPRRAETPAGGKKISYFPGCSAEYLFPEIAEACRDLFAGYAYELSAPKGLACCGLAVLAAGDREGALQLARKNIAALEGQEGPILVSCASCYAHLSHYRDLFADDPLWRDRAAAICERLVEMMQFLDQLPSSEREKDGEEASRPLRVFYHDPCHLRNDLMITAEPRRILRRMPGVELVELPDGPQCCGQGGLFHLGAPELSAMIRDDLASKVFKLRPDIITSTCSGCLMQWKTAVTAAGSTVQVLHLAEFLQMSTRK